MRSEERFGGRTPASCAATSLRQLTKSASGDAEEPGVSAVRVNAGARGMVVRIDWEKVWKKLPAAPFCFLGFAFARAWAEVPYLSPQASFPFQTGSLSLWFDGATAVALAAFALGANRIAPLSSRRHVLLVTVLLHLASNCLSLCTHLLPSTAPFLSLPAVFTGGVGVAFALMLWAEFFSCFNALKIALYYSMSLILSFFCVLLMRGLAFEWLWTCNALLPAASMLCLWRSFASLPEEDRPPVPSRRFSFPFKPALVVALYAFALGMTLPLTIETIGVDSNPGVVAAALVVYGLVMTKGDDLDLSLLWKLALPATLLALVPLGGLLPFGDVLPGMLASGGYTLFVTLIMCILGNLSYRYGICALWLFAIERFVRLLFGLAGTMTSQLLWQAPLDPTISQVVSSAIVVILIGLTTLFFFSEKQIDSPWGVVLKNPLSKDIDLILSKTHLGIRCHEVAQECGLTPREEQILLCLLQKKKPSRIAEELCIEVSTIRVHVKHIYRKTDVHSRNELLSLVGLQEADAARADR